MPEPNKEKPEEFLIRLKPVPHTVPVFVRLRRFLKAAFRAYGFRCEFVDEKEKETKKPDNQAAFDLDAGIQSNQLNLWPCCCVVN